LFVRKRNNINKWKEGQGVAHLRKARINGRIVDRCQERASILTNMVVRDIDMCNGELPVECFPAKPPCSDDDDDDTYDGTTSHSDDDDDDSNCTDNKNKKNKLHQNRHHEKDGDDDDDSSAYHEDFSGPKGNFNRRLGSALSGADDDDDDTDTPRFGYSSGKTSDGSDDDDDDSDNSFMTLSNAMDCIGCEACSRVCPKACFTHSALPLAA
jgi:NAD-dependent dihydropyrimidine dehydrogenase PreA subunit